jgi:hypothetical protein
MAKTCALSGAKPRGVKPREKPCQIYGGDGLYVEAAPSGPKIWRVKKSTTGKSFAGP